MSLDEKGRVHYELSVTGGQAGGFFLGLLVALCLAFFFGMRTGSAARRSPDAVPRGAASPDFAAGQPAAQSGPDDARLRAEGAGGDGKPAGSRPRTSATEPPLGFEEESSEPVAAPPVRPSVREEPAPPVEARERPPAATARAGEKAAAPREAPDAAAASVASEGVPVGAGAASAAAGDWYVQVLATQKAETADDTAKRLKAAGYSSDVTQVPGKPGLFRVRVGPYRDRASAEDAAARVPRSGDKTLQGMKPIVLPGGTATPAGR